MTDLSQFDALTKQSKTKQALNRELSKSGLDYAMESMQQFTKYFAPGNSMKWNQIPQFLDQLEQDLIAKRNENTAQVMQNK